MTTPSTTATLLAKLGTPLPVQVGTNPNGAWVLCEARNGEKRRARVMIEADCGPEQIQEAAEAALAVLARGRRL